jgi:S1-C subfamily serine protease
MSVDGKEIDSAEDLTSTLTDLDPGASVPVEVFRDDDVVTETVELGSRPTTIPVPE